MTVGGQAWRPDGLKLDQTAQDKATQSPDHVPAVEQVRFIHSEKHVPADRFNSDGLQDLVLFRGEAPGTVVAVGPWFLAAGMGQRVRRLSVARHANPAGCLPAQFTEAASGCIGWLRRRVKIRRKPGSPVRLRWVARAHPAAAWSHAMIARAGYGRPQHAQASARDAGTGSFIA